MLIYKYGVLGFRQDLLNRLTGLAADVFANIANTFAFVGLRWIIVTNFSGELANELLVDSFHLDLRVLSNSYFETFWNGVKNWV